LAGMMMPLDQGIQCGHAIPPAVRKVRFDPLFGKDCTGREGDVMRGVASQRTRARLAGTGLSLRIKKRRHA